MAVNTTQGIVLAIFGANAGGHLTSLDANATANGNASLATDLSAAAGLILGVDLSTDAAFTSTVLGNLGIAEDSAGYTLASNYFTTNLAAGAGRGDLVAAAVEYLLGSSVDASLTDSATAFSTRVTAGVEYSQGEGASVFGVSALQTAAGSAATAGEGESFELTSSTDTLQGTAGNDTFTGTTTTLSADDRIIDASGTDSDVFNLTATAQPAAMNVTGIESINVTWDAFTTPDIDLDDVSGSTVTLTSSKVGFLGNAGFDTVGSNGLVFGDGITRAVTVDDADGATITANNANSITLTNSDGDNNVTANAAETVTIDSTSDNLVVSALAADTITVGATSSSALTVGATADVTLGGANADHTITGSGDEAVAVELQSGSAFDSLVTSNVSLTFADTTDITTQTVTSDSEIVLADDVAAAAIDLGDVSATSFRFESVQENDAANNGGTVTITVDSGASLAFETSQDAANEVLAFVPDSDESSDSITVTLEDDQAGQMEFAGSASTDFENVNIIANATTGSGVDVTITDLQAGTGTVTITSAENEVTVSDIEASEVDATGVAAAFVLESNDNVDMTVAGGSSTNNVTFAAVDNDSTFVGQDGNDTVTFITEGGIAAAVVGGGNNTVTADSLDDGQASVISGDGNDTVSLAGLTSGTASLTLGGGNNTTTLDGTFAGVEVVVDMGAGTDTVTIGDATTANDEITLNFGDGNDTLVISEDITAGTLTVTGLETIDVNAAVTGAGTPAIIEAGLLSGTSLTIKGQGTITETFDVDSDTNGTLDFSGLQLDATISNAIGGMAFTARDTTGAYTVTGTDGADTFDFQAATGNNTVTPGEGADKVTLDGTDGTDVLIYGVDDLVAFTATDMNNGGGTNDTVDTGDTITFGDGFEKVTNFELNVDTLNLTAFGLESGALVADGTGGANADGANDGDVTIGDGEYQIVNGTINDTTGVFTVNDSESTSMVFFDADTTSSVELVGIHVTSLVTAADLSL